MITELSSRRGLVDEYMRRSKDMAEVQRVQQLCPTTCARLRDPSQYAEHPFDVDLANMRELEFGEIKLRWIDANTGDQLLRVVGLHNVGIGAISYCDRRAEFLREGVAQYQEYFSEELGTIAEFTSALVWGVPNGTEVNFGNAAYYRVPHVTYVSDGSIFFIPPLVQLSRAHGAIGFLENLYHEALHHKAHAYCALTATNYCVSGVDPSELVGLSMRKDRTFSISQSLNACDVYSTVTILRARLLKQLGNKIDDLNWLHYATQCAAAMWYELAISLSSIEEKLLPHWRTEVQRWKEGALEFVRNNPELQDPQLRVNLPLIL